MNAQGDAHDTRAPVGPGAPEPRELRRRRTEALILAQAQQQFAQLGFERTTIRSVAAAAAVDPALVMQYFGSKEALFAVASRWEAQAWAWQATSAEEVPQAVLDDLFAQEDGVGREAVAALMRNCLTHPGATEVLREQVVNARARSLAEKLPGEDALLRATLLGACMVGLMLARNVLGVEPLASASREDLARLMGPALRCLAVPEQSPEL